MAADRQRLTESHHIYGAGAERRPSTGPRNGSFNTSRGAGAGRSSSTPRHAVAGRRLQLLDARDTSGNGPVIRAPPATRHIGPSTPTDPSAQLSAEESPFRRAHGRPRGRAYQVLMEDRAVATVEDTRPASPSPRRHRCTAIDARGNARPRPPCSLLRSAEEPKTRRAPRWSRPVLTGVTSTTAPHPPPTEPTRLRRLLTSGAAPRLGPEHRHHHHHQRRPQAADSFHRHELGRDACHRRAPAHHPRRRRHRPLRQRHRSPPPQHRRRHRRRRHLRQQGRQRRQRRRQPPHPHHPRLPHHRRHQRHHRLRPLQLPQHPQPQLRPRSHRHPRHTTHSASGGAGAREG